MIYWSLPLVKLNFYHLLKAWLMMDPLVLNGGGKSKSASGESGVATCSVRRDRQTDIRRDIRDISLALPPLKPPARGLFHLKWDYWSFSIWCTAVVRPGAASSPPVTRSLSSMPMGGGWEVAVVTTWRGLFRSVLSCNPGPDNSISTHHLSLTLPSSILSVTMLQTF